MGKNKIDYLDLILHIFSTTFFIAAFILIAFKMIYQATILMIIVGLVFTFLKFVMKVKL